MRIFVTGATGFIGRALTPRLVAGGDQVTAWVRDESRARAALGPAVGLASAGMREQVVTSDAIVNLAGEPVFGGRWTVARKRALAESRLNLTRAIAAAIAGAAHRPSVLISASAVGFYGDRGDEVIEDDAASGTDFLATLCRDWELAALEARASGVRVFIPRIGIVLGAAGGALPQMIVPFRFGMGGPVGSGRQFVPWIHLDDLVRVILLALEQDRFSGPMIAAAPNPVTSRELATTIGAVMHRPSFMPVPAFALKLLLGEAAAMLLTGQRVRPRRLEQAGFEWRFPTLRAALEDILRSG